MIVPKVEFPDVHLGDLVGQQGAHQFKVKRGHTKLYTSIKRLSRVEYFTTTVVNNLLYYLGTQPILT